MVLRGALALVSALVAAVAGVVTNAYSTGWAWPWGVALAVLVVATAALQMAQPTVKRLVWAEGTGSVVVAGSVRKSVRTRIRGGVVGGQSTPVAGDGLVAGGAGSVVVGGDVGGGISTSVHSDGNGSAL